MPLVRSKLSFIYLRMLLFLTQKRKIFARVKRFQGIFHLPNVVFYSYIIPTVIFLTLCRNEKCLSSVAAGNWLLRKSYLEECRRAGCFVDEEPHEWGAEIPGESLTSLAVASRRWRIELAKVTALTLVVWLLLYINVGAEPKTLGARLKRIKQTFHM